jgi:hypothetical protein
LPDFDVKKETVIFKVNGTDSAGNRVSTCIDAAGR